MTHCDTTGVWTGTCYARSKDFLIFEGSNDIMRLFVALTGLQVHDPYTVYLYLNMPCFTSIIFFRLFNLRGSCSACIWLICLNLQNFVTFLYQLALAHPYMYLFKIEQIFLKLACCSMLANIFAKLRRI